MKTINKTIVLLLTLSLLIPIAASAKGGKRSARNKSQTVVTVLTVEQQETLFWMREEEKLARDVYLALYDQWDVAVFKNIANSEQKHMNAILRKIKTFGLTDPAVAAEGEFTNPDLQQLYTNLVIQGEDSYINALIVGATIEDLDIADLIDAIEDTDNLSLKMTYQNLLEGSKRHLRAFTSLMKEQGEEYTPEYIEQDLYDAILVGI